MGFVPLLRSCDHAGAAPFTRWNEGGMEIITVSALENLLNSDVNNIARGIQYNFFSEIPDHNNVRTNLKTNPVNIPSGTEPHTAFLLANEEDLFMNTTIGHDSVAKNAILNPSSSPFYDSSKIGFSQIRLGQIGTREISINQFGTSQIRSPQISMTQTGTTQVSPSEISPLQTNLTHRSISEIGSTQVNTFHVSFPQVGITQINPAQINIDQATLGQVSISKVSPFQVDSREISFSSSISPEQFFSFHNAAPQIINDRNNSATNIWSNLLQSETSLDIDFHITDLPKGQLAEATITGFDSSGKPKAGTILIDHDANGLSSNGDVGWFIDETPLDNSEFTTQNQSN